MRFFYVTLVVAVTLLASANAVPTKQKQISETSPDLVTRSLAAVNDDVAVKRNLRKYIEEDDNLDSLDSLDSVDETEERAKGFNAQMLNKLVKAKRSPLLINLANFNDRKQLKVINTWVKQGLNKENFATKLGMSSILDTKAMNYPIFQKYHSKFLSASP